MWKIIACTDGYVLRYNGRVVAISERTCAMEALTEFSVIVANVSQAVPA